MVMGDNKVFLVNNQNSAEHPNWRPTAPCAQRTTKKAGPFLALPSIDVKCQNVLVLDAAETFAGGAGHAEYIGILVVEFQGRWLRYRYLMLRNNCHPKSPRLVCLDS